MQQQRRQIYQMHNSKQIPLRLKLHPASLPSPHSRAIHKAGPDKVLDAFSSTREEISEIGRHAHPCPQTPILKVSFKNASGSVFWSAHPRIQLF